MRRRFHLARQPVRSPRFSKADRDRIFEAAGRFLLKPRPDPPTGNVPPPSFSPLVSRSVEMRMKTQRRATDTPKSIARPRPPPRGRSRFPACRPDHPPGSDPNFPPASRIAAAKCKIPSKLGLFPEFPSRIPRGRSRSLTGRTVKSSEVISGGIRNVEMAFYTSRLDSISRASCPTCLRRPLKRRHGDRAPVNTNREDGFSICVSRRRNASEPIARSESFSLPVLSFTGPCSRGYLQMLTRNSDMQIRSHRATN